tara:strand:+ start:156 stop:404 length:249 start_codon:yes stop_codon:yes gene_type:complete
MDRKISKNKRVNEMSNSEWIDEALSIPMNEIIDYTLMLLLDGELEKELIPVILLLIIEDDETQQKLIKQMDINKMLKRLYPI